MFLMVTPYSAGRGGDPCNFTIFTLSPIDDIKKLVEIGSVLAGKKLKCSKVEERSTTYDNTQTQWQ